MDLVLSKTDASASRELALQAIATLTRVDVFILGVVIYDIQLPGGTRENDMLAGKVVRLWHPKTQYGSVASIPVYRHSFT